MSDLTDLTDPLNPPIRSNLSTQPTQPLQPKQSLRPKRLVVIGHSLAAAENRAPFEFLNSFQVELIVPKNWQARSLATVYRNTPVTGLEANQAGRPQVHVLSVFGNGLNSFFFWMGLRSLVHKLKPDLIYCWQEPWCLATFQVTRIAVQMGVPVVFFSAENRAKSLPWVFHRLQAYIYRSSQACIVPTRQISDRVRTSGFSGPIFEIPLWILPRHALAVTPSHKTLVYVGRLIPLKRVHLLIECLRLLPEFRLRIIGDGPEKSNLIALTQHLDLASRVQFLGHVNHSELPSAIQGSSLLLLPTGENSRQAEQFGKAALEGLASGLPVLASRTGNLLEMSLTLPNLFARDLNTPTQIATAITAIWENYPDSKSLESSRFQVLKLYHPEAISKIMHSTFLNLCYERPGA